MVRNKIIKLISALLIVSILSPTILLSTPQKAQAQWSVVDIPHTIQGTLSATFNGTTASSTVTNTGISIKNAAIEIGKQLLKIAAKRLLAKMTQATINWINSDFHGSPLFIENPESFFKDIAKSEIRNLVDMIGYDTFRFPFGKDTALNVINSYKRQLADNAQYSLSKVINDPDLLVRYRNDFSYGGWNGFLINTQYPQNNYLGFQMIIQQNLASRLQGTLQAPAQKIQNLLQQGMGFLSPQTCPSNPKYNNGINEFQKPSFKPEKFVLPDGVDEDSVEAMNEIEDWRARNEEAEFEWVDPEGPNVCPGGLVNTTPGSVAGNQIMKALNVPMDSATLAGALGNSLQDSVSAIFDALINKFLEKGLNTLSNAINPPPKEDNWSYDGQTLDGRTVPSGTPADLNIPQNVSVSVGETTSTIISGGTAPYRIKTAPDKTKAVASISTAGASGSTLIVTGGAPAVASNVSRTAIVEVQDSSNPVKTVTVTITINAIGAFVVNPPFVKSEIAKPVIATISGGEEPYFIRIDSDEKIATAVIASNSIVVSGTGKGKTFVEIEDSSFPNKKTTRVQIEITVPDDLVIPNTSVKINEQITIPIKSGKGPFVITNQSDTGVSAVEILSTTPPGLKITGLASGVNIVTVTSALNKSAVVVITTLAPLGNCHKRLGIVDGDEIAEDTPNTTEAQCKDTIGGTWTANPKP